MIRALITELGTEKEITRYQAQMILYRYFSSIREPNPIRLARETLEALESEVHAEVKTFPCFYAWVTQLDPKTGKVTYSDDVLFSIRVEAVAPTTADQLRQVYADVQGLPETAVQTPIQDAAVVAFGIYKGDIRAALLDFEERYAESEDERLRPVIAILKEAATSTTV